MPVKEKRRGREDVPDKPVDSVFHPDLYESAIILHPSGPYNLDFTLGVS
jgi:hypothetical protein